MASLLWLSTFLILTLKNLTESKPSIVLREMEMCDKSYDYPITFTASHKIQNGEQYVNLSATLNAPLGQNQWMNASFEISPKDNIFLPLFKFTRSNLCDFLNRDLGPFWFELQKAIAVPTRTCPIPIGRYNVRNYQLPYGNLHIPVPSGLIRSYIYIVENKSNRIMSCLYNLIELAK